MIEINTGYFLIGLLPFLVGIQYLYSSQFPPKKKDSAAQAIERLKKKFGLWALLEGICILTISFFDLSSSIFPQFISIVLVLTLPRMIFIKKKIEQIKINQIETKKLREQTKQKNH